MFKSTYIPVNMRRANCAVYSCDKKFPEDMLLDAYNYVQGGQSKRVYIDNSRISFIDNPTVTWTLAEIYLAYEAYAQAKASNFSYYMATDSENIPQLFISKSFMGHRLIVNAFTMRTLLLSKQRLSSKAASLIDKNISWIDSMNLFDSMVAIESGSAKYLTALIAYRGAKDSYMAVSPVMCPNAEYGTMYGIDEIEEIKALSEGKEPTDDFSYFKDDKGSIVRKGLSSDTIVTADTVSFILSAYDKVLQKKSNYVELRNENYETELYFSTNNKYLVNARTFECIVIHSQNLKALINSYVKADTALKSELQMIWIMAGAE